MRKIPIIFVILLLLLLLLTRLSLYTKYGRYFMGDEIRYNRLIVAFKDLQKTHNPFLYMQGVFAIQARPGYAVFYTPAIWLEKLNRDNPDFEQGNKLDIPYGMILNIFVNSCMVFIIYLILKSTINIHAATLATIVVLFSIPSVIYLRHMLPYDLGLTFLLLAFYIYLRRKEPFLFGVFAGISFLIYPSYSYYLIPIPFLLLVFSKETKSGFGKKLLLFLGKRMRQLHFEKLNLNSSIMFVVGFVVPLILAELFSRLVGADSYFLTVKKLGDSVAELRQGDFMPALPFIIEYIRGSDGNWGLLIAAFAPLIFLVANKKGFLPLIFYLVTVFFMFEIFSHLIPKSVLYGRTIRPYYFLLLISSVICLDSFFTWLSKKIKAPYFLLYSLFVAITITNWWPRFNDLRTLEYPPEIRNQADKYLKMNYNSYKLEDVYTKKRSETDAFTDPPILEAKKFYLVNPTFLYPYYGHLDVPCTNTVLFERKHAITFKAYDFEGFSTRMREQIVNDPPKYQLIYCQTAKGE